MTDAIVRQHWQACAEAAEARCERLEKALSRCRYVARCPESVGGAHEALEHIPRIVDVALSDTAQQETGDAD